MKAGWAHEGAEKPPEPEISPRPSPPDIQRPGKPAEIPEEPARPDVPKPEEPAVTPGKTREPEVPTPAPPEPHE